MDAAIRPVRGDWDIMNAVFSLGGMVRYSGVSEHAKAAKHRLEDAEALFHASRWRGAMYIAGYSVESLLKTKLMRMYGCRNLLELEKEPRARNRLGDEASVFTHQLEVLLDLTGARGRMRQDLRRWQIFNEANRWLPGWRYAADAASREEAEYFLQAVQSTVNWIENNV